MTTKHTPGPWHLQRYRNRHNIHIETDGFIGTKIARIAQREEQQANAQLIAAAPELLEACKMATPIAETLMDELTGEKATNWGIVNDGLIKIKQAINKAEGKEVTP